MNNKNIEIENIEIKEENANNVINVEIKNEPEFLIAAHNASKEAHEGIVEELEEKINTLKGTVNELENNMVLSSNLPGKLSDFENDVNFVSEETLIQSLEIRGLVNNTTLNEKENEINNLITTKTDNINTKIENLKKNIEKTLSPEAITTMCMPSSEYVVFIAPSTTGTFTFTMPENGILLAGGRARTDVGIMVGIRLNTNSERMLTVYPKDHSGSFEMLVNKGDSIKIWTQNFTIDHVRFFYLNGTVPKEEEQEA